MTLQVRTRGGAVNTAGVNDSQGQLAPTEKPLRHDDFDARRQREIWMSPVVDLLERLF
jgi:hypothetical protein